MKFNKKENPLFEEYPRLFGIIRDSMKPDPRERISLSDLLAKLH